MTAAARKSHGQAVTVKAAAQRLPMAINLHSATPAFGPVRHSLDLTPTRSADGSDGARWPRGARAGLRTLRVRSGCAYLSHSP